MSIHPFLHPLPFALLVLSAGTIACADVGYTDTPIIPGTEWRVHDGDRPQPPAVAPGKSFSEKAPPPEDATVLFDGRDLSQWETAGRGEPRWKVEDGYMEVVGRSGNIRTRERFGDMQLHLEFATPGDASGGGQGGGNSGVFFHGLYEVQILNSYGNITYADGHAGAVYGQTPPLVNASKAPGEWQTYDFIFEAPRWDDEGNLVKKANVTLLHNGILVHHKTEILGVTRHRALADYNEPHAPEGFIELQDHGDPVRFRNIWVRPLSK